ncbi:hypothetical protein Vadar_009906 [Vaccinium darrowii]|uniref:Uncharacterized protein n=1 Tax=Vaccinium darrowii TaxID=229202 RepID=A0ACB7XPP3_9ERIC|nr:hypothetical protein Vadar_009906 [Vaccinium darrowii]
MYMAQPSYAPLANYPIPIVGPQFCAPYPVDLSIMRRVWTLSIGNFVVSDVNGNLVFKVKGSLVSLHDHRVLLDSFGNPLVTLRRQILSAHNRWQVFRGESSDLKDLLFTAKTSSVIQLKTTLNVFLAHNTREEVCDFKVKGSWTDRSCVIYAGESSNVVAQMHMNDLTFKSVFTGKDKFTVTVYPHVDHAFIVALIVILDEIAEEK